MIAGPFLFFHVAVHFVPHLENFRKSQKLNACLPKVRGKRRQIVTQVNSNLPLFGL